MIVTKQGIARSPPLSHPPLAAERLRVVVRRWGELLSPEPPEWSHRDDYQARYIRLSARLLRSEGMMPVVLGYPSFLWSVRRQRTERTEVRTMANQMLQRKRDRRSG
jgi:hypothetical protein